MLYTLHSYLEIYNERVRDLFVIPSNTNTIQYSLKVREDQQFGPYVQGKLTIQHCILTY